MLVFDNFLPEEQFDAIKTRMMQDGIGWRFNTSTLSESDLTSEVDDNFMFTHTFWRDGAAASPHWNLMVPILERLQRERYFKHVGRVKANLYTNQNKTIDMARHVDVDERVFGHEDCFVAIYFMNTCNGRSVVKVGDEFVACESRENRMLIFDNVEHYGTVQTDTKTRVLVNFVLKP